MEDDDDGDRVITVFESSDLGIFADAKDDEMKEKIDACLFPGTMEVIVVDDDNSGSLWVTTFTGSVLGTGIVLIGIGSDAAEGRDEGRVDDWEGTVS